MAGPSTRIVGRNSAVVRCEHFVDGARVWCPPMCPYQFEPRPTTSFARWRWNRAHRKDTP